MGIFGDIGSFIMTPLYYITSAIMIGWHELLTILGLDPDGGASWILSIVGLTVVIRAALIPLFVKQIKSSRNMQLIQPKVKELQKKYGHDRQRLAEEQMKLFKESGTNPFASCLPILLQMPIFFALFRLLDQAAKTEEGRGFLTDERAVSFAESQLFGSIPIKETFQSSGPWGDSFQLGVVVFSAILVVTMTATTFLTQRQLMSKNMPPEALTGQYAQQQKILLYVLPFAFGFGGVFFPIGVLIYWTTSNIWTMGQQFYVIRNNPVPGTPAFKAKQERDRQKAIKRGENPDETAAAEGDDEEPDRRPATRQQPKRQTKAERKQSGQQQGTGAQSNGQAPGNKGSRGNGGNGSQGPRQAGGAITQKQKKNKHGGKK